MANLYKEWSKKAYEISTQEEYDKFWNWYLPIEKDIYNELLTNKDTVYSGTVTELATKFKVEGAIACTLISLVLSINMQAEFKIFESQSALYHHHRFCLLLAVLFCKRSKWFEVFFEPMFLFG